MIRLQQDNQVFYHRAVALFIHQGRVLLHRIGRNPYWSLPGGRVSMMEASREAVVREMQEELEVAIQVDRLVWVVENFFREKERFFHELGHYYLVSLPDGHELYRRSGAFEGWEEGTTIIFQWHPLEGLEALPLNPGFLPQALQHISEGIRHIVSRDAAIVPV